MKILLCATNFCKDPLPVYPLGMGVIANILAKDGHEVRQFDPLPFGIEGFELAAKEKCAGFNADMLCASIRNLDVADSRDARRDHFQQTCRVVRAMRALCNGPLVLGGPGFSLCAEEFMRETGADYGVTGEGESAMLELARKIAAGTPPGRGAILNMPATRISGARYSRNIAQYYNDETHNIPIQTKRGCPFKCVYCTYPMLEGSAMRLRPIKDVLEDIRFVKDAFPDSMIYFTDSVFNDPSRHFEPLLTAMVEQGLDVPWTGFITPSSMKPGDIELMAASGLVCADLGIDGTTDETLAGLGKRFSFSEAQECCRKMLELNIGVNANVMFGGPGETWDTVAHGIQNMRALEPVFTIAFAGIRVLSGAPLIETARREGAIPNGWDDSQPLYYFAPGIGQEKLHNILMEGFAGSKYCVYPPSSRNDDFRMMHKFGYVKLKNMRLNGTRRRGKA